MLSSMRWSSVLARPWRNLSHWRLLEFPIRGVFHGEPDSVKTLSSSIERNPSVTASVISSGRW